MNKFRYFSRKECLMGRDIEYPLTEELESNLDKLLIAINKFRELYGRPMVITSGYRPGHYNKDAGGAKNSTHCVCMAFDFKDVDGELKKFATVEVLKQCGLYMEHPDSTNGWMHVQIRPTKNRIFKP